MGRARFFFIPAAVLLFFLLAGCNDDKGPSGPWGMLGREKVIYVVTTENPADLEDYRVRSGARQVVILPISLISLRIKEIGKSPIIFLINRGKRLRCSPEEERLLPYATDAIKPNAVVTFMSKDRKRDPRREGAWDILISAPSSKWLFKALDEFVASSSVSTEPQIREINSVAVVATDGREIGQKWIKPIEHSTDWEFYEAGKLDESLTFQGFDEIYLINQDAVPDLPQSLLSRLPKGISESLASGDKAGFEILAEREMKNEGGIRRWRAAIVAPSRELLESQMSRYARLEKIPESLCREELKDLSAFTSLAVVARPSDRDRKDLVSALETMSGSLTSALSQSTRFRCANRQDMKEAIYEALKAGQNVSLDPSKIENIGTSVKSHLLLVAEVMDVSTLSTFKATDPEQITPGYGRFDEPAPSKPDKPDLSDRRYGIMGPKVYKGADDPKYREDMRDYEEALYDYERACRRWEARRWEHEERAAQHDVEWKIGCNVTESASVSANIRLYSLEQAPGYAPGVVIFSCPMSGSSEKTRLFKEDRVVVRGEGRRPGTIVVPPADSQISDPTVVAEAIDHAVDQFISTLHSSAILPGELANSKPVLAGDPASDTVVSNVKSDPSGDDARSATGKEPAVYEETGSVDCDKSPKPGTESDSLKRRAFESACRKLLTAMMMTDPGTTVTLEELYDRAEVVSQGWHAATRHYRVKIRYARSEE